MKKSAVTLVELTIFIVVIAIVLAGVGIVIVNSLKNTALPEYYTIASSLAKREMERVVNQRFFSIVSEGPINYTGNFSQYSYQVVVNYVNGKALNTPVPGATNYKRIQIIIRRAGFPDVSLVTLATNN